MWIVFLVTRVIASDALMPHQQTLNGQEIMMFEPDVVASGLGVEEGIPRAAPALGLGLELELGPVVVGYNTHGLLVYSYMGLAEHHLDRRAFLLVDVQ